MFLLLETVIPSHGPNKHSNDVNIYIYTYIFITVYIKEISEIVNYVNSIPLAKKYVPFEVRFKNHVGPPVRPWHQQDLVLWHHGFYLKDDTNTQCLVCVIIPYSLSVKERTV